MKPQNIFISQQLPITIWHIATCALLLFCITTVTSAQTAEQIAEKALAATVYLEMKDSTGKTIGFGSGFFVKPNLIATNYHVIAGAASGTAKLVDKYTKSKIEGFTAIDETNDLALLKVTVYGIKPLPLGNSGTVRVGETVYVVGNPFGLEGTFSDGIISSRRDRSTKERLQMTAPVSAGSSGGAVLNRKGEVIGVSYMTIEGGQNLNFAIPSRYLKSLLARSNIAKPLLPDSHPISTETYFQRGNMMYYLARYQEAIAAYTHAIHLKPDAANAYLNRGNAKVRLGQHFAAIQDYDKAIQLKPGDADAYYNRGNTKVRLGQHFAAIQDYDKAIQLKPDYANAYIGRGIAKANLGQYFAAIQDFDKAIQLKPDYANAYYSRGNVKYDLGQHFAAIQDFDKAIQLKPDYVNAYYNRGLANGLLGQHFAAIQDFDKTIQLKPDYANAYYYRGLSKVLLNRTREAKQDCRTALRLAEKVGNAKLKADAEETLRLLE